MSDVPWALGRRAMVLTSRGWRECEGMAAGRHRGWVWTCPSRNFIGEPSTTEVFETTRDGERLPTTLLPDQCSRCYDVGAHADGCMVAANLARGVPEFWAPWVMWVFPDEEAGHALYIGCGGNIERLYVSEGDGVWLLDGEPVEPGTTMESLGSGYDGQWLICLGPNGPTLAPWGKP